MSSNLKLGRERADSRKIARTQKKGQGKGGGGGKEKSEVKKRRKYVCSFPWGKRALKKSHQPQKKIKRQECLCKTRRSERRSEGEISDRKKVGGGGPITTERKS